MKNLFNNRKTLYLILGIVMISVFTLTIAYAALNTILEITGTAEVNAADWDIHFSKIVVDNNSVEAITSPTLIDVRTINFAVALNKPGDFYKFSVDVTNGGSIDAVIDSIVKSPELTAAQAKFIKYDISYSNGDSISTKQLLEQGGKKTLIVELAYRTDIVASDLPTGAVTLDLSFTMNYVQSDDVVIDVPSDVEIKVVNGDLNTVGSEIAIGDEHFYLMKNDSSSITMLSKYNLHVGNKYDSTNKKVPLENPTGIQDETAKGYFSGFSESNPIIGNIEFASTNYWYSNGLKPEYGTSYPVYVFNSNSNLYQYVENYETYLTSLGATVEQVRLIDIDELVELGCSKSTYSCTSSSYSWVYSTSYWTGSAYSLDYIWRVTSGGIFDSIVYTNSGSFGLRPVVKISLADFS